MTFLLDPVGSRHAGVAFAANAAGEVVSPQTAPRGEAYTCLACQESVILRRGTVRVPHFAHRAESNCSASGESIEHAAFKRLLAAGLRTHRALTVQVRCPACGHDQTTTYPLTPDSEVREEVPVEGFRADVGVLRAGQVVLALEVYVTHEVGAVKALALQVPWLEVSATSASLLDLRKKPRVRVHDTNLFRHRPCKACGNRAGSQAEATQLHLLAQEAAWREAEERRKVEEAEARRLDEAYRLRHDPQVPESWITVFTPQLASYRAPLYVTVQGVRLLVHPCQLPPKVLSETASGRYVFQNYALRFISTSGREEYAAGRLGTLLDQLLLGTLPVAPEAEELLAEVRAVLRQSVIPVTSTNEVKTPCPIQPTLWG